MDSSSHFDEQTDQSETICPFENMKKLRLKHPKNVIVAYLNINSIRNKFTNFSQMINKNVDVLVIAETKLDGTFPKQQFVLEGYKEPYRLDVTSNSGGILVYINEQFRSKIVTSLSIPGNIQTIPIEINLRNKKWLLLPIYRPPAQNEAYFIAKIQTLSDCASVTYKHSLIFGDFNMDQSSTTLSSFVENNGLYSMIKTPTCFKSTTNPRCIDLMLTNMKHSFFGTQTFETGFSDCHHMIYTILKTQYTRLPPKKIRYRDYKRFSEDAFLSDLSCTLTKINPKDLNEFGTMFASTLDKHAPHLNKTLRKAMMQRTRLKNIANKTGNEDDLKRFRKQRNLVVKLNRDAKRNFYNNIDPTKAGKEKVHSQKKGGFQGYYIVP